MKIYIFIAVASMLALISCSSDDNEQTAQKTPQKMTFTAGFGGTRTTLNHDKSVSFDANDQISIFSTNNTNAQFTTSSGGAEAEFTGTAVPGDGIYYAVYPYKDSYAINGNIVSGVTIAYNQLINNVKNGETWTKNSIISYATTTGSDLQFHNACALLRINNNIYNNTYNYVLIQITVDEGQYLTGTFNLDVSSGELTATAGYNFSRAAILGVSTVYIPIAPGSYTNFTVKMGTTNNMSDWKSKTKANVTFEAGKIYNLGTTSDIISPGALLEAYIEGYLITYTGNETWGEAITNHPKENVGWSYSDGVVLHVSGEEGTQTLYWDDEHHSVDPNEEIDLSIRYKWH